MSENTCKNCKHYTPSELKYRGSCTRFPDWIKKYDAEYCGEFEKKASPPTEVGAGRSCGHPPKEEPKKEPDKAEYIYQKCPKCSHMARIPAHLSPYFKIQCHKCLEVNEYEDWRLHSL